MFQIFNMFLIFLMRFSVLSKALELDIPENPRKFPDDFLFGVATAAYQIEGAWDVDGKTESIWDHATHKIPSPVADNSTGDIANDSYNLYKRDIEMLRELGVNHYRFSISWPRILPTSFPDYINEAGIAHYNNVINELLKYNIEPLITIYHWDLPQKLQEMGGWTNPHIVDWYADYARVLFQNFGDRVKYWITINEPREVCSLAYARGILAPSYKIAGTAEYICGKNLLMAHAKAYHIYDEEFRPTQDGKIFIALSCEWYEPESNSEEDAAAARDITMFDCDQHAHPIFSKSGDYPESLKERIATKSAEQGFFRSRLPELTPEEIEYIRGTSDYYGLNHYSSHLVYRNESLVGYYEVPSYHDDAEAIYYQKDEWAIRENGSVRTVPWGFYKLLRRISNSYNDVTIFITENGFDSHSGLEDDDRITHLRLYLNAVLDAIENGSDVRMYTVWNLMDDFEWMSGFTYIYKIRNIKYRNLFWDTNRSLRLSGPLARLPTRYEQSNNDNSVYGNYPQSVSYLVEVPESPIG